MNETPEQQLARVLCMRMQEEMRYVPGTAHTEWNNVPPDVKDAWIKVAKAAIEWKQEYYAA